MTSRTLIGNLGPHLDSIYRVSKKHFQKVVVSLADDLAANLQSDCGPPLSADELETYHLRPGLSAIERAYAKSFALCKACERSDFDEYSCRALISAIYSCAAQEAEHLGTRKRARAGQQKAAQSRSESTDAAVLKAWQSASRPTAKGISLELGKSLSAVYDSLKRLRSSGRIK